MYNGKTFILTIVVAVYSCMASSCGNGENDFIRYKTSKEKDPRDIKGVEPVLQKYIYSWEKEFGLIGDISIGFKEVTKSKNAIGVCLTWTGQKRKYKQIEIKRSYYNTVMKNIAPDFPEKADKMIEQLVYHELGHCHLEQDHRDYWVDGKPGSIMRSFAFNSSEIQNYYIPEHSYYVEELKTININQAIVPINITGSY